MSVPAYRFRSEDQKKKGFRCKISGFAVTFTRIFVLERKFAYAWREHKLCFRGAQAAKCTPVAPGLFFLGGEHNLRLGVHNSRLGGRSSDLGFHGPEVFPRRAEPALYIFANLILDAIIQESASKNITL